MILILNIKLVEIPAPAPNADDKIFMILGMLLRVEQNLSVYRIQLKLMASKVDKRLYQSRHFFYAVGISKRIVMYFHSQGAAVDDLGHIVARK